jgi:DNA (cytosine-5)-methyltransferase 1
LLTGQYILPIAHELIVDLFAGGGGASTGIERATGRHVDIAINHDPEAVSLHQANHPQTQHFVSDVFEVDPVAVCGDRPVGLLWASPDCKHFSKAKGGKPRSKKIRALADVIVLWAEKVRPRVICMENVEEFKTWGELDDDGYPIPERAGELFKEWRRKIEAQGYVGEFRELRACDYNTPTIRKRLFGIFRCDGEPIVWPEPTHGPGRKPYRTAAECIDWSLPCPSIFERDRPLAEATIRRIAHGIKRYVLDTAKPFIVPVTHPTDARVHSIDEPLRTITGANRGELALASPTLIQTGYGERPGQAPRVPGLDKPLGTAVDGQKHALVAAFLAKHYGGNETPGWPLDKPISTVTTQDHHHLVSAQLVGCGGRAGQSRPREAAEPVQTITAKGDTCLVTSHLAKLRGTSSSAATDEPLHTVSAGGTHHAEVRALLLKYYGTDQDPNLREPLHTVTTKDRFGLVTVKGEDYFIADIGMRMLQPRELYRAQGFPESYIIDRGADGRVLSKAAQVRMCGNSVCPPLASAIVAANYSEQQALRRAA